MKNALLLVFLCLIVSDMELEIDFGGERNTHSWNVINDGVMGGLSQGEIQFNESSVIFEGEVSLENNGGFSSFKSPYDRLDLSNFSKMTIRYKSEGIKTAFTLETYYRFYQPNYKYSLENTAGEWMEKTINLADFQAYRMGRKLGRAFEVEDVKNIVRIGFITNEKRSGPFKIEIDYLLFE